MGITTEQLAVITSAAVAVAAALSPVLSKLLERGMLVDAKAAEWRAEWWARRCGAYEAIMGASTDAMQTVWDADGAPDAVIKAFTDLKRVIDTGLRVETNSFASPDTAKGFETLVRSLRTQEGEAPAQAEARVFEAYHLLCDRIRREMRMGPRKAKV